MPNTRISDLTAAVSVAGTDVFPSVQTAGVGPVKTSLTQITNFALANAAAGAVGAPSIAPTGDTNTGFWFPAADTIAASTAGSERLRITSAGDVGIGTASPSYKLDVRGIVAGITAGTSFRALDTSTFFYMNISSTGFDAYSNTNSVAPILFSTAGSEKMRVTSAGRVGIGITAPQSNLTVYGANSTDGTAAYTMNVLNPAIAASGVGSGIMFGANVSTVAVGFDNIPGLAGIEGLKENGTSGDYASALKFTTRINGGSLTERMRISSAGNVGIGTTNPADNLEVSFSSANVAGIKLTNASQTNQYLRLMMAGSTGFSISGWDNSGIIEAVASSVGSGTRGLVLSAFSGPMIFQVDNRSEKMRITSAGNVGIGTTTISGRLTVDTALTGTPGLLVNSSVAASYASTLFYGTTTTAAGAGFDMIGVYANTVAQFRVRGDGTIYAQNTTVQAISDVRLKDNIRSALDGLSTIMRLRPVRFDWKEGYGNGRKNQLGFVAQEVETVFPDAVDEMKISNASDEAFKTVGPSAFIPVLVKAIQELAAELNELKGKINA
jgi:hypothetical protein